MARRAKVGIPELEAHEQERKFKRKRAKLKEAAAKELADIQLEARRHTDEILKEMIKIALSDTAVENAKIQAANFVYDRAYGKASQTNTNVNVNANGKPSELTGSSLTRRVEATLRRIEELTGRGEPSPVSEERPADVCQLDIDTDSTTKH